MSVGTDLELDLCSKIGEMRLSGLPPRPAGEACTVFMEIDREGLLTARGIHDKTGKRCQVTIKTERVLSKEEALDKKSIVVWFVVE